VNAKMVIAVRRDLRMRRGKEGAQVGHASMWWLQQRLRDAVEREENGDAPDNVCEALRLSGPEVAWLTGGGCKKVVVQVADLGELLALRKRARDAGLEAHLVVDAGLTEFGEPTPTCVGIGPDREELLDPVTGDLELR